MNRIFQDVQKELLSALLQPILKNPVHPVYVPFILHTRLFHFKAHFAPET